MSIDPGRWERVKSLFQEVFERDPSERTAYLDAACGDDRALRDAVQQLLNGHAGAGTFLDTPLLAPPAAALATTAAGADPRAPARIGQYRVIRELGKGGMGAVYLAERDDPRLRKTVAIKVVHRDSHVMLRRFQTETRILAGLEHPRIARLYDGGTTEDGLPYFVMEYVAGENILVYCDAHHLSIDSRLQLFRRVCDAVQYAHQSFIVHRDLKPSNILVGGDGEPKLLDFGIAKLLHPAPGEAPLDETREISRVLTPQYASPEHVRGEPVTTASDVYSLGVILFELLSGQKPYRITAQQSTAEIERAICEADAPAPSTVAPANLRGTLRGDLDNIVLKALRKDPHDRYGTATELADDVRRHLEGFPVVAQRDRFAYRAGKFMRRHRLGVAAASIASLSLIGGMALALWQAQVARSERDRARIETTKARQIAAFLSGIFQSANPEQARGKTVTARELLDRATASIGTELKNDPDAQASLLLVMSAAYDRLALPDTSLELAERSLRLREESVSRPTVDLADSLYAVGRMKGRIGQNTLAVPYLERALTLRETLLGTDNPAVAQTLVELALARSRTGQTDGLREMLGRAISILERAAPATVDLANAHNVLGIYFQDRREFADARASYERSIAVWDQTNEARSWGVAIPLMNLGDVLRLQGDHSRARSMFERALAVDEKVFGAESQAVAYVLGRLGDLEEASGNLPAARRSLERSLAIYAKTAGGQTEIADLSKYLGRVLLAERRPADALPLFERALRITEQTHGSDHADVAESLVGLGRAYALVKGPAQGEPLLRRALAIQRRVLAADNQAFVPTLTALGQVLAQERKSDEARALLEEAVRIAQARLPEPHADRAAAEAALRGF